MAISASMVKELREKTGAGMMDCKKALVETDGDFEKAVEYLQKKSLAAVGKRADRVAAEGQVGAYIHTGGRIGALVEINCETDFVAIGESFQQLVRDVAMHVAAARPEYLDASEVPADLIERQREIFLAQLEDSGKPANILGRIVDGKIKKWLSEVCLLEQAFVKEPDKTVGQYVTEVAATTKENIRVRRFTCFVLGEGIEKKESDFAAEVAAAAGV
ncbi:MAG: translation elongation factor Ts [Myxococcales bacterium]|nr:translation elongation factor Ts [Myxococcales bacterium]